MTTFEKQVESRPPIPTDPLPQAGDSLWDELYKQVFQKGMWWVLVLGVSGGWVSMEWYRYVFDVRPTLVSCIVLSVVLAILGVIGGVRIRVAYRNAKNIRQGIRGEKYVSQYLNLTCRSLGYRVIDDIQAKGSGGEFNIDHVLIGPGGIFSIETKTWRLPGKGTKAELVHDPKTGRLTRPDRSWDEKAVAQTRANADFLRKLLAKRTGRAEGELRVIPVLILPGWFITDPAAFPREVWIMGNETLHKWLQREPKRLSGGDVAGLAAALEDYVRNYGK